MDLPVLSVQSVPVVIPDLVVPLANGVMTVQSDPRVLKVVPDTKVFLVVWEILVTKVCMVIRANRVRSVKLVLPVPRDRRVKLAPRE